ncbi:MAG: transferase [Chloroflexi bacterium]|nr:transferase [Chloroflexota bacterium]
MADDFKLYPNVSLGEGAQIGEYAIIGAPPRGVEAGELATVIGRRAVIRSHAVIYAGCVIGDSFQTGHGALVREHNHIGDNVSIGSHTVVEHHVSIGNNVRIHSHCFIPEFCVLEDGCWIGPRATFTNDLYPPSGGRNLKGPTVKRGARIGANATLLPGVVIGENALVGAGAVVVRDVPPETVVIGNPARVIKRVSELRLRRLA